MQPFDFLNSCVKSYARPSKVHGVGLFALVDIKKGEYVFPLWGGETGWYEITLEESQKLPKEVLAYLLRSYSVDVGKESIIKFKLVKDTNFLFSSPLCLLNTKYEQGNLDSWSGVALRDIKKDEEIFGNYGDSSQIKLL